MVIRTVNKQGQELKESIRLCLLQLGKASAVNEIDVERLETGDGMRANRRMMCVNWGATGFIAEVVL